jgi:hypothetical protein
LDLLCGVMRDSGAEDSTGCESLQSRGKQKGN